MSTSDAFSEATAGQPGSLWNVTWTRINKFLPNLKAEIFPAQASNESSSSYAALMMGVGKTLFSTELPKMTAEPVAPAPIPSSSTTLSQETFEPSPAGHASDVIQGVEAVLDMSHQTTHTTEAEDESSLL